MACQKSKFVGEKNPLEHNYFVTFFESRNRKIEKKIKHELLF